MKQLRSAFSPSIATLGAALLLAGAAPLAAAPRSEIYQAHCSVCHGEDGASKTEEGQKKGARDLTNAKWQAKVGDERLGASIDKGRGRMPAFGKKLTPDEVKALVAEVRTLAVKK